LAGHPVEIRCIGVRATVAAKHIGTNVIGHDQDDVRPSEIAIVWGLSCTNRPERRKTYQQENRNDHCVRQQVFRDDHLDCSVSRLVQFQVSEGVWEFTRWSSRFLKDGGESLGDCSWVSPRNENDTMGTLARL
jgi:hypothetical protein